MDFTLWHQVGVLAGAGLGYLNFRFILSVLEPRLRALDASKTTEERGIFERKMTLLRRILFVCEIAALAVIGYFAGGFIGAELGG